MTEKRFTLMSVVNFDYGINDNDKPIGSLSNICDLMNRLNDENEQLKQRITELELLNDGLNYALKYIKKIDVEIDVGDD